MDCAFILSKMGKKKLGEVGLLGLCERSEKWGNGVKRGPTMAAQWWW
jgi:hypothetical protein